MTRRGLPNLAQKPRCRRVMSLSASEFDLMSVQVRPKELAASGWLTGEGALYLIRERKGAIITTV